MLSPPFHLKILRFRRKDDAKVEINSQSTNDNANFIIVEKLRARRNLTRPRREKSQACVRKIRQRDFLKRTKAFFKLSRVNNFIQYTDKEKWVE